MYMYMYTHPYLPYIHMYMYVYIHVLYMYLPCRHTHTCTFTHDIMYRNRYIYVDNVSPFRIADMSIERGDDHSYTTSNFDS